MKTGKKRLTGTLLALCAALLVLCIVFAAGWSKTAKVDAVLPEVRNNGTAVQWKYRDETDWRDLVALTELTGAAGENGKNGTDGKDGSNGTDGKNGINGTNGKDGINGIDGKDGQNGIDGKDGTDGSNGADGKNGINGTNGKDGMNGVDGTDGVNGKDGMDAKNIEVQRAETHIQWRYEGGEWQNLVAIADIEGPAGQNGTDGANGKTPEFRVSENILQWRYVDDEIWLNLYDLTALKGADGRDGVDGKDGINGKDGAAGKDGTNGQNGRDGKDGKDGKTPFVGENGNWWIGDIDTAVKAAGIDGTDGVDGEKGDKGDKGEKGDPGEKGDKGDKGDPGEKGDKGDKGDPGQNGGNFGYFAANGRVYSWGTPLPFNVKKESGDLISYDASSKTITLSKGHTYSMVFSGTVMISANGTYKLCGASLIDGYNSSEMMLETRTYVSMINDGQSARLGMSYNTIYRAEENIALTFQYTNMLFQNTNFTDSQYNITIIALD